MAQKIFKKPSDMRYVDLCIWIDENFYKDDCDYNTAYTYMWLIAYMLAAKQKYFNTQAEYEEFSSILAYSTYQRMMNKNRPPIKSVLNYMKSILYFRKCAYDVQKQQRIIDPKFDDWDPVSYTESCKSSYEVSVGSDRLFEGVTQTLKDVPRIIKKNIPKVFKGDKVEYENIYISCLLSMINKVTLPAVYDDKLQSKLESSPTFDEVKYYKKYLDNDIILWHLPESFEVVVMTIINKVNNIIVNEINDLSDDIKISEVEFNGVMTSGFNDGGSNETDY